MTTATIYVPGSKAHKAEIFRRLANAAGMAELRFAMAAYAPTQKDRNRLHEEAWAWRNEASILARVYRDLGGGWPAEKQPKEAK